MPELQGEPEDISKEKARLAALQVLKLLFFLPNKHLGLYLFYRQMLVVILVFGVRTLDPLLKTLSVLSSSTELPFLKLQLV